MLYFTFPEVERSCQNWQPFQKRQFARTDEYTASVINDIHRVGTARWISFMTSAVYSHTTRNKSIQYYCYCIDWSWLCSEILTILMYAIYVSLQALQMQCLPKKSSGFRQACVGLPTPSSQNMVALTLLPCLNIFTFRAVFVFGDFYQFFSVKASENFMNGQQRHSGKVVLFENDSHSQGEPLCYDQGRADGKRVAYCAVSN